MKSIRMLAMLFAAGSLMLAACEPQPRTTDVDVRADEPAVYAPLTAGDLVGQEVENRQGETLGTIDDFAVDLQTGRMTYALVSTGGVLGVGAKHRAIPVEALDMKHRIDDPRHPDDPMMRDDPTMPREDPRQSATGDAGQTMTPPDQTTPTMRERMDVRRHDEVTIILDMPLEEWEQQPTVTREDFFAREQDEFRELHTAYGREWRADLDATRLVWATDLRGATVVTRADERTGSVDEVVVNVEEARVPFVIVSTAGVLDVEDDRYMVPTNMLTYDVEQNRLTFAGDIHMFRDAREMRHEDWETARHAEVRDIYVFRDFDGRRGDTWGDRTRTPEERESPYN